MQMYILMVDYRHIESPGMEAVVSPEHTRRQIVDEVRSIHNEGRNRVVFVKYVDGNFIEDVTEEIEREAAVLEEAA